MKYIRLISFSSSKFLLIRYLKINSRIDPFDKRAHLHITFQVDVLCGNKRASAHLYTTFQIGGVRAKNGIGMHEADEKFSRLLRPRSLRFFVVKIAAQFKNSLRSCRK